MIRSSADSDDLCRSCWIDVRDLAEAHVLAIKKQEAGGERIIISGGPYKWQDFGMPNCYIENRRQEANSASLIVDAASKLYPKVSPRDETYDPKKATHPIKYDTSKAAKLLGLKYHSIEENTKDVVEDFKARAWI